MNGQLPKWLSDWLGLGATGKTDGATWQLDSVWSWAPWVTLLTVLAAIMWTVALYAREQTAAGRFYRGVLAALRLTALAALAVMLAQWTLAIRLTGPPPIALVMDRSASMNIVDRWDDQALAADLSKRLATAGGGDATRIDVAKLLATEKDGQLLRELGRRYRLNIYSVAESVEQLHRAKDVDHALQQVRALTANGSDNQSTRLGEAVRRVLADFRGNPPAAVVLLSDGVTTAGTLLPDAADDARRAGVPIFALGIGNERGPRDIIVSDVLVDDAVFVGDIVNFQVQIKAEGFAGQPARVTLRRGDSPEAAPLAERTVTLPPSGQSLDLQLLDRPAGKGDLNYVVAVEPQEGEIDRENNQQRRTVSIRDEKIRVLLACGYPNYEFRYLKNLLERDPSIDLATFLQDAEANYTEQDKSAVRTFPVGRSELFRYDVLILGDLDARLLPRSVWQHVRAFVLEKGGGAIFIAGPRFLPWLYRDHADLISMLPVEIRNLNETADGQEMGETSAGFKFRPTPLGLLTPSMQLGDEAGATETVWQQLSPQYWRVNFESWKPAAQVFAIATSAADDSSAGTAGSAVVGQVPQLKGIPLIAFQYFGAGRVLLHAVDSTWLWRRGTGDRYFARYWVQTVRFLARGKLTSGDGVTLSTDRREYLRGETTRIRARFFDVRQTPAGDAVNVAVEATGRDRRTFVLRRRAAADGVFEGTLADLPEGEYQILLAEPQAAGNPPAAKFRIIAPPGELARPAMDRAALTAAAEISKGKFYTVGDADRLLAELPPGRPVPMENLPPIEIWNRWWLLAVFLGCLSMEWILRKRAGML
jgi:hypothetical protein